MTKILMIDDDKEVLEINKKFFEERECAAYICSNALEGEKAVRSLKPDCILLDIMMPDMDGITLCKKIRKNSNVPILFLSGKVSENDKLEGFEAGADDYIEKPYSLKELFARIAVHVRRNSESGKKIINRMVIDLGRFSVDKENHRLLYNNEEILLSNKEYDLILFLAQNVGKEVLFEDIGRRLWGNYMESDRRNVMVNVSRLRKKIEAQTGVDNFIETIWSKGYKLVKLK